MQKIELTADEIKYAHSLGRRRQQAALSRGRRNTNNLRENSDHDLRLHQQGCCGEFAGKKFLEHCAWNEFADEINGLPDLVVKNLNIDVKTVDSHHKGLLLKAEKGKEEGKPDWAYLLVSSQFNPQYFLMGWMWGRDILKDKITYPQPNRPARLISNNDFRMKNVDVLRRLVERLAIPTETFEHACHCGRWGAFGVEVNLLAGETGKWYCFEHWQQLRGEVNAGAG